MEENTESSKEKESKRMIHGEEFFEEVAEYLDEVARGEMLTADDEANGSIQMLLWTDDDEDKDQTTPEK